MFMPLARTLSIASSYALLTASDLQGAEIIFDGRGIVDIAKLSPIEVVVLGVG